MRHGTTFLGGSLILLALSQMALGQIPRLRLPDTVEAGSAFTASTIGSGSGVLYIVGPAEVLRRTVQLGDTVSFSPGDFHNAGHYLALLVVGPFTQTLPFDVVPSQRPASLSFLAKPSRLPVNRPDGISGVVYVFDAFRNLVLEPLPVSFVLSGTAPAQSRNVETRNGVAWIGISSAAKTGPAQFEARVGSIRERRVVQQVAGDPCRVKISARQLGSRILLETDPVRDCSGNPVPDGTIVSFTETYDDSQATVDAPLKRGIARAVMPARRGAVISAAIGVVMGNEIRWSGGQR
jgi:hypothetical protein